MPKSDHIRNGENPAHPLSGDAYTNFAAYDEENNLTSHDPQCQGLTKREYFAGLAMQAMLSSEHYNSFVDDGNNGDNSFEASIARNAIKHVDALLAELEK